MNLRGVVSVTGKPGLFKLVGQNKTGFILESLDEKKIKVVVNISTAKMASLEDITIFGEEDDIKLVDVLERMKGLSSALPDAKKDSGDKLRAFFKEVAPKHDEDRVYASDIKKIINWYGILKELPLFEEEALAPLGEEDSAEAIDGTK
jgi:hypothetical protein